MQILAGSVFLLLIAIEGGSAIKCFECNSHKDPNCALDIPPDNLLKDCSTEYPSRPNGASTYCRKIKQNIEIEVNNLQPDSRIIRKCGFEHENRTDYCYTRSGDGGRQIVCTCDQDKCNGGEGLYSTHLTAVLATLFATTAMFFIKF
ncbi:hypothetical protein ACFFRR_000273 [Megaselia abdita]